MAAPDLIPSVPQPDRDADFTRFLAVATDPVLTLAERRAVAVQAAEDLAREASELSSIYRRALSEQLRKRTAQGDRNAMALMLLACRSKALVRRIPMVALVCSALRRDLLS